MPIDKTKTYKYHIEARGNELDAYKHVNNSVYLNYMEQARWVLFREAGLLHHLDNSGNKIVVVEQNIRYMKEIKLFDEIIVETRVKKELPYMIFNHRLLSATGEIRHARAKVKTLLMDENNTPVDIPDEIFSKDKV